MDINEVKEISAELDLETLESRLEMEALAAMPESPNTTPVSICHFW